jgi:uncharacterized protein YecT (DUF1311 family)
LCVPGICEFVNPTKLLRDILKWITLSNDPNEGRLAFMRYALFYTLILGGLAPAACSAGASREASQVASVAFTPFVSNDVPGEEAAAMAAVLRNCIKDGPGVAQCDAPDAACMRERTPEQCLHQAANAWAMLGAEYYENIRQMDRYRETIAKNQTLWYQYASTACDFVPKNYGQHMRREEIVRCNIEITKQRVAQLRDIVIDNSAGR